MVASFLDSIEKVEQAIRAEVDRRKNPHNSQSNKLNVHSQGRMPTANFTETRKRSKNFKNRKNKCIKKISRTRKSNVPTAIKLGIRKRLQDWN